MNGSTSVNIPNQYLAQFHRIQVEVNNHNKAKLLWDLGVQLLSDASRLRNGVSDTNSVERLYRYRNFVEENNGILASRHNEFLLSMSELSVKCSLDDVQGYFQRFQLQNEADTVTHDVEIPNAFVSMDNGDSRNVYDHFDLHSRTDSSKYRESSNRCKFAFKANRPSTMYTPATSPVNPFSIANVQLPNFHRRNENRSCASETLPTRTVVNKRKHTNDEEDQCVAPQPFKQSNPETIAKDPILPINGFCTGNQELKNQYEQKYGHGRNEHSSSSVINYGTMKKSLGLRRPVSGKFVSPFQQQTTNDNLATDAEDERLLHLDSTIIETIRNEIMHSYEKIDWNDIAGLDYAKNLIIEAVIYPMIRPDLYTGIREPTRGILLFGPPGTGKTLIGKCIASQSNATFFSISASSLTSKYIGEGEKLVRALFALAAVHEPSVVFIDEIDSLLCQRSDTEHESSRRLKTEFLLQFEGTKTTNKERILIVGATNRPQELDEAARRRFVKRLYIPLPDLCARKQMLQNLLKRDEGINIEDKQIHCIGESTDGFSGADIKALCQEASMFPMREIEISQLEKVSASAVRPTNFNDFLMALENVRASVSQNDLQQYIDWNQTYGSGNGKLK